MSVSLIKLKNGVEIIGDIIRIDDKILLENPMQVNYRVAEQTSYPSIFFSKYCQFSSEEIFQFDMDYVLHVTPVKKSIEKYYSYALDQYKNVTEKYLENELVNAIGPKDLGNNEVLKTFLKKVKIDGYAN